MARTLTSTISSALSAGHGSPAIQVTIQDQMTRFSQLASITNGTQGMVAAFVTSAGTILRALVPQAAQLTSVQVQRITSPTTAAQWTAAYATITSTARRDGGCAFAQQAGTIRCFYQRSSDGAVCYRDSTDDGVTWGAENALPATPIGTGTITYGISAVSPTEVYVAQSSASYASAIIYHATYSAGVWSAWANVGPSSPAWGKVRGLQVWSAHAKDYFLAGVQTRAGTASTNGGIAAAVTTYDGTSWSAWSNVAPMDNGGLGLSWQWPSLWYDGTTWYAATQLQDDGSISGAAGNRASLWTSTDFSTWTLIAATAGAFGPYGAQVVTSGGLIYLFDPVTVYTTSLPAASVDVTADLTSLTIHEAEGEPASIALSLSNGAGQYLSNILTNAQITVNLGYNGSTIKTHVGYVDQLIFTGVGDRVDLTIGARGVGKFLDAVSQQLFVLQGKTVAQLATFVCAQARVALAALPGTSQFSQTIPCFVITPGETWGSALQRVASIYGFTIQETAAPAIKITEKSASDHSGWTYGTETLGVAWGPSADQANIVRVIGSTGSTGIVFAEAADNGALTGSGMVRYRHVVERMLDTSARCAIKAGLLLRDEQAASYRGTVTVPLNPQHELMDVITITDSRVGLSNQSARIHAIDTEIHWHDGTWLQHLALQKP